jgi:hypothetical protein
LELNQNKITVNHNKIIRQNDRSFNEYTCVCGYTGLVRKEYANKIKSCRKCQFKPIEVIEDPNNLWCNSCKKVKNKKEFCLRKDGTKRHCKSCERSYRKANQKRTNEFVKQWGKENPNKKLHYAAKARAKARGLDFTIEIKDIVIPDFCPLLNIPILIGKDKQNSPSLDRIDSSKGYTKDNIQVISWRANWLKNNATIEELITLADNLKKINL